MTLKTLVLMLWLGLLVTGIAALFWYNEWKYTLPTPVPEHYQPVSTGVAISVPHNIASETGKPLFIHFFNPDCPCSKFNVPYFKTLVKDYSSKVDFAIVVLNNSRYTSDEIREKFHLDIPVIFDSSLAAACGVYSTPQAVLLDKSGKLYYRGNYNRSRYCTEKKTAYAQQAIDGLLNTNHNIFFDQFALKAYGCELPNCTKQ
jgi:hypothetical protein